MSGKTCPMCGAVLSSPGACPACGETIGKVRGAVRRIFLGLPVFETFCVAIFLAIVCAVTILPLLTWIRSLLRL